MAYSALEHRDSSENLYCYTKGVFTRNEILPLFSLIKNGLHGNKWGGSHLNNFGPFIGLNRLCTNLYQNSKKVFLKYWSTRKHSSRMRTVRLLGGGVSLPGGVYPSMHWGRPPPLWTEWLTDRCKNITFPQLRLWTVIICLREGINFSIYFIFTSLVFEQWRREHNYDCRLPEGFTQLLNLTELYLNDTFLDYLPGSFGRWDSSVCF